MERKDRRNGLFTPDLRSITLLITSVYISTAGEIGELSGKTTSADVVKVKQLEERRNALIQNLYQNRTASLPTINV